MSLALLLRLAPILAALWFGWYVEHLRCKTDRLSAEAALSDIAQKATQQANSVALEQASKLESIEHENAQNQRIIDSLAMQLNGAVRMRKDRESARRLPTKKEAPDGCTRNNPGAGELSTAAAKRLDDQSNIDRHKEADELVERLRACVSAF